MNRNENEAESFAGNFMAFGEEALFFEVPNRSSPNTGAGTTAKAEPQEAPKSTAQSLSEE